MIQTASYDNPDIVLPSIRDRYSFFEVRNACGVLAAVARDEWMDIIEVLDDFSFSANLLLQRGKNNSEMADRLNRALRDRGWAECKYVVRREGRIDYRRKGLASEILPVAEIPSYWVDNRKGRVLVDVEWNAKDGNLDRDLAAYRAWYEDGLIDGAVIITKDRVPLLDLACSLWAEYLDVAYEDVYNATRRAAKKRTERERELAIPLDLTTTTVTSLDQAKRRVGGGEAGTCPVAVIAVSERTWDRTPYGPATPVLQ